MGGEELIDRTVELGTVDLIRRVVAVQILVMLQPSVKRKRLVEVVLHFLNAILAVGTVRQILEVIVIGFLIDRIFMVSLSDIIAHRKEIIIEEMAVIRIIGHPFIHVILLFI